MGKGTKVKFDHFLQRAAQLEGIAWRKYRRPTARRAVEERMSQLGLTGYESYLEFLSRDQAELAGLADRMHITVTRFFRDAPCWRTLAETVLPEVVPKGVGTVRAWSAGCCGGEEAYTLGMIWLGDAALHTGGSRLEIISSDIDEASLERARVACYEKPSLREVPPDMLERFFTRQGRRFCVSDEVRSLVRFERCNIMTDPLPVEMDLVCCRYLVFTYYRGARARAAAERLWGALSPGGVLMIGKKEELSPEAADLFAPIPGAASFFRRRG